MQYIPQPRFVYFSLLNVQIKFAVALVIVENFQKFTTSLQHIIRVYVRESKRIY